MVLKLTLDTNCVIDVEENRTPAVAVRNLVALHHQCRLELKLSAISASENKQSICAPQNFKQFKYKVENNGLQSLSFTLPIFYFGITFLDYSVFGSDKINRDVENIHHILFGRAIDWCAYASAKNVPIDDKNSGHFRKWKNNLIDALAFEAHTREGRDVFVTSDQNFQKLTRHPDYSFTRICAPTGAVSLIQNRVERW